MMFLHVESFIFMDKSRPIKNPGVKHLSHQSWRICFGVKLHSGLKSTFSCRIIVDFPAGSMCGTWFFFSSPPWKAGATPWAVGKGCEGHITWIVTCFSLWSILVSCLNLGEEYQPQQEEMRKHLWDDKIMEQFELGGISKIIQSNSLLWEGTSSTRPG